MSLQYQSYSNCHYFCVCFMPHFFSLFLSLLHFSFPLPHFLSHSAHHVSFFYSSSYPFLAFRPLLNLFLTAFFLVSLNPSSFLLHSPFHNLNIFNYFFSYLTAYCISLILYILHPVILPFFHCLFIIPLPPTHFHTSFPFQSILRLLTLHSFHRELRPAGGDGFITLH